jgi:DNA-binding LytR/AlgR family response regulator
MRIAICEDIQEDAERLNKVLAHYLNINGLSADVDRFESGEAFLAAFVPGKYQIIFMDIYMKKGGLNGVQAAENIHAADRDAAIILITNSGDFMVHGYRVAVYYIVKPVSEAEMEIAMSWCRTQLTRFAKTIEVTINREPVTIRLRDIHYIEAQRRTCVLAVARGEMRVNMPLDTLTGKIGGYPFVECHRSFIVNLVHVADMLDKDFVMENGVRVPVSKAYAAGAGKAFREYVRDRMYGETV